MKSVHGMGGSLLVLQLCWIRAAAMDGETWPSFLSAAGPRKVELPSASTAHRMLEFGTSKPL